MEWKAEKLSYLYPLCDTEELICSVNWNVFLRAEGKLDIVLDTIFEKYC